MSSNSTEKKTSGGKRKGKTSTANEADILHSNISPSNSSKGSAHEKNGSSSQKRKEKSSIPSKSPNTSATFPTFVLVKWMLILTTTALVAILLYNQFQLHLEGTQYPGLIIEVQNVKRHIYCTGVGFPTVILESEAGAGFYEWGTIQSIVSQFTRVCSFDRMGIGFSDSGENNTNAAQEIYTLLKRGGIEGPYLAVGHGYGALRLHLFAQMYASEVTGLIFVDPLTEYLLDSDPLTMTEKQFYPKHILHNSPFVSSLFAFLGLNRIATSFGFLTNAKLPSAFKHALNRDISRYSYWTSYIKELQEIPHLLERVKKGMKLGDMSKNIPIRGVIFTPVGQEMDAVNRGWAQNLQYFVEQISSANVQRFSLLPNLADNDIANEISDEIRRMFGSSRKEDFNNWVYVTSEGLQKHEDSLSESNSNGETSRYTVPQHVQDEYGGHSHGYSHTHSHGHSHGH